tara:strand:- start:797 stop:1273 length:477 start_codon:yes stop_codon:yes gene_type:complete
MSNTIEKIKALNLPEGAAVTLEYSDGTDVFVHNESEVETALENTDVVETFSSLITTPGLNAKDQYGQDMLDSLRSEGLLDDYERGSGIFEEYVSETIQENFYDVDLIDYSVEKYDYKRGFCTLSACAVVSAGDLIDSNAVIDGWKASVKTESGTLTIG